MKKLIGSFGRVAENMSCQTASDCDGQLPNNSTSSDVEAQKEAESVNDTTQNSTSVENTVRNGGIERDAEQEPSTAFENSERRHSLTVLDPKMNVLNALSDDNIKVYPIEGNTLLNLENKDSMLQKSKEEEYPPWIINPHFAAIKPPYTFWRDSFKLILIGAIIGLINLGYKYCITAAPKAYLTTGNNANYPNDPSTVDFATGKVWWIGLGAATGLINGVLKVFLNLGHHPGFMAALQMQRSDPVESFKVVICTLVSLIGGSSVGPEAGLAAIGGGIGSFLSERVFQFKIDPDKRKKVYILSSMSAAFTAFLPSPLLAVMMTWELGIPPAFWGMNQVHALTLFVMSSVPAAAVFFAIEKSTIYDPINLAIPESSDFSASKWDFAFGICYGVMGACLAIAYYIVCNLVRTALIYPKKWAGKYLGGKAGPVCINVMGGVIYGTLGYLFPLTMGDGSFQLQGIIQNSQAIGSPVLACSCFANMISFWVSMETGFVGGIFTPMLAMGNLMGAVFANITSVNGTVSVACSFIALASAVIPAPLFLVFFSSSLFRLGAAGLIPITTCAFTSHLLIDGIGLLPVLSKSWVQMKTKGTS